MKEDGLGIGLECGSHHYRAFVGPPEKYDLVAVNQFIILINHGFREYHKLLDIGCGSLRGGRLFIPYLLPKNYFGIEPEQWLIDEGIKHNVGQDLIKIKKPKFSNINDFSLDTFGIKFDFILAQSIFSHASQDQIRQCLKMANKVMHDKSVFLATFVMSDKNSQSNSWTYANCVNYTLDLMKEIASEYEFALEKLDYKHPNNQTWVKMTKT